MIKILLDEIGYFLQTQGVGTLGTNLFKSFMPNNPYTCVTIYEHYGRRNQFVFGKNAAPAWESPRLQVVTRSTSYETARKKIETIYRSLELIANTVIAPTSTATGCLYINILPVGPPLTLGLDVHELLRIACNFEVTKALST